MADYAPTSRFVLRAPIYPFSRVLAARELLADPIVREAIVVAAPDLDAALAAPTPAAERAFARYVARLAGRATPFGLFASLSIGTFARETRLELGPLGEARRRTRLDHDYLVAACRALAERPELRARLVYTTSSSLYELADQLRYVEATRGATYELVEVEATPLLRAVLDGARDGGTPSQLADLVVRSDPEVSRAEAEQLVGVLIESQLLVPDLAPPLTGDDPVAHVSSVLERVGSPFASALAGARDQLAALDRAPLGQPRATYDAISGGLRAALPEVEPERWCHSELHRPARATLGPAVVSELARAIELLRVVGSGPIDDPWPAFRDAFDARYGTREVPLAEVLDEDLGIGFGGSRSPASPLLAELGLGGAARTAAPAWGRREARLLALASEAARTGAREVVLSDGDVAELAAPHERRLQDTVGLIATLVAESPSAIDEGNFTLRVHSAGSPAARLLARFAGASPELSALVAELVRAEQASRPHAVFAEVVHEPGGRTGNLLSRPRLRSHEIPFLGTSGAPRGEQIAVRDLLVSVVDGRVVLHSRALGREVLPHLTSAFRVQPHDLAMYRFLAMHAWQDGESVRWRWGVLQDTPFLPRVRRGRIVLVRARWRLERHELRVLSDHASVAQLRARRGLPRWIALSEVDQELPIDLDDRASAEGFAALVRGQPTALAYELYPDGDALVAEGPGGRFVHELVVPMVRREPQAVREVRRVSSEIARRFPPGSPWLFAKLYCGRIAGDVVVSDVIAPLVEHARAERLASSWFFMRYSDPDPHVRVRFTGESRALWGPLLAELHARCESAGALVWRVALDTYEREVERYGGAAGIELAEQIFEADSDAVLALLAGDEDPGQLWLVALAGVGAMLDDLGMSAEQQLQIVTAARDRLAAQAGVTTAHKRRLGATFRSRRAAIEHVLGEPDPALAARSKRVRPLVAELRARGVALEPLAYALCHMHVNRMLAVEARGHELAIYDFLRRLFASRASRR